MGVLSTKQFNELQYLIGGGIKEMSSFLAQSWIQSKASKTVAQWIFKIHPEVAMDMRKQLKPTIYDVTKFRLLLSDLQIDRVKMSMESLKQQGLKFGIGRFEISPRNFVEPFKKIGVRFKCNDSMSDLSDFDFEQGRKYSSFYISNGPKIDKDKFRKESYFQNILSTILDWRIYQSLIGQHTFFDLVELLGFERGRLELECLNRHRDDPKKKLIITILDGIGLSVFLSIK